MTRRLAILLGIALACRGGWWALRVSTIENEGSAYARLAESLFSGHGYVGLFGGLDPALPPLYPILIGLVARVVGDTELAGRLVSLTAGLALVPVLYYITRHVFGEQAALVAGVVAAVHPILVGLSVSVYVESLSMFLVMLAALFALQFLETGEWPRALAAGATLGLDYLARPEALAFSGLVAVILGASVLARRGKLLRAVRVGALTIIATAAVGLPYVVFLSFAAGGFHMEGKSAVIHILDTRMASGMSVGEAAQGLSSPGYTGPFPEGPYLTADQLSFFKYPGQDLLSQFRLELAEAPDRGVAALRETLGTRYLAALLAAAVLGAAASGWRRANRPGAILLAGYALLQVSTLLVVAIHFSRYFFPLVPVLIPWAAAGITIVSVSLARVAQRLRFQRVGLATTLVAIVLAIGSSAVFYRAVAGISELSVTRDPTLKEAGLWIAHQAADPAVGHRPPQLMSWSSTVSFYSGAILSYLPYSNAAQALAYVHRKAPDYLAIRSDDGGGYEAPYAHEWFEQGIPDTCAVPAFEARSPGGPTTRVWRWSCEP